MVDPRYLKPVIEFLSYFMLIMGLMLAMARTVHSMIRFYQYQCGGLAVVTFLTFLGISGTVLEKYSVLLFALIPVLLACFIEPFLAQATVPETVPVIKRLLRSFNWRSRTRLRQRAMPAWLRCRRSGQGSQVFLLIILVLIILAFILAFTLSGKPESNFISSRATVIAVSFSLLLLGLWVMIGAEDMISQVMGLLMMEQGMFLAVIQVISSAAIQVYFVLGLLLYVFITLTILVFLLPELHHASGSLDIDQQTQLKG